MKLELWKKNRLKLFSAGVHTAGTRGTCGTNWTGHVFLRQRSWRLSSVTGCGDGLSQNNKSSNSHCLGGGCSNFRGRRIGWGPACKGCNKGRRSRAASLWRWHSWQKCTPDENKVSHSRFLIIYRTKSKLRKWMRYLDNIQIFLFQLNCQKKGTSFKKLQKFGTSILSSELRHCLGCLHLMWVLAQVPASVLPVHPSANVTGRQRTSHHSWVLSTHPGNPMEFPVFSFDLSHATSCEHFGSKSMGGQLFFLSISLSVFQII